MRDSCLVWSGKYGYNFRLKSNIAAAYPLLPLTLIPPTASQPSLPNALTCSKKDSSLISLSIAVYSHFPPRLNGMCKITDMDCRVLEEGYFVDNKLLFSFGEVIFEEDSPVKNKKR